MRVDDPVERTDPECMFFGRADRCFRAMLSARRKRLSILASEGGSGKQREREPEAPNYFLGAILCSGRNQRTNVSFAAFHVTSGLIRILLVLAVVVVPMRVVMGRRIA
jgi:hypothetical protein